MTSSKQTFLNYRWTLTSLHASDSLATHNSRINVTCLANQLTDELTYLFTYLLTYLLWRCSRGAATKVSTFIEDYEQFRKYWALLHSGRVSSKNCRDGTQRRTTEHSADYMHLYSPWKAAAEIKQKKL